MSSLMRRIHHSSYKFKYSQNFLKPRVAEGLVSQMQLYPFDQVIEIGPGTGQLTRLLLPQVEMVLGVEQDARLAQELVNLLKDNSNFLCINSDFLQWDLPLGNFKIVGNIPFAHTAEIMWKLVRHQSPPQQSYLIMQREAAAKFSGTPRETLFSLRWKPVFDLRILREIDKYSFSPVPRVDAALLQVSLRQTPLLSGSDLADYRNFVEQMFTGRQPTVKKELRKMYGDKVVQRIRRDLGIDLDRRKGELGVEEWIRLWTPVQRSRIGD
jgi:23S rRNA (adenine-N6)-dimethyltransferase